jgi:hypothetical protein
VAPGWFEAGKTRTLGLALDLETGTMRVSVDGGEWAVAFPRADPGNEPNGCTPSAAVGAALFPALSGYGNARVRCNFGGDAGRPFNHSPPSGEYRPVAQVLIRVPLLRAAPLSAALPFLP